MRPPRLQVRVSYIADQWPATEGAGRAPYRGIYRARLIGFGGCEGTGATVHAAIESLAAELVAHIDADDYLLYMPSDGAETVETVVASLARAGELVDALTAAADDPVLEGEV
jgi:hypothetical protein